LTGAAVDISSPFDRGFYRLFTSPLWLAIFQILMPLFNYYVSASGMVEAKRIAGLEGAVSPRKLSARRLAMFILMVESSSCFIFGTSLILGNYGPTMLPSVFHRAMFSGLMTPSLITTLVLALHMHEESRGVQNLERRPVFTHYRRLIVLSTIIFCICGEIGYIMLTIIPAKYFLSLRQRVAAVFIVCMAITQFGLALFFISKSKFLAKSVSEYMVHPGDSDVRVRGVMTLRRLKYWGFAASGAMIVNSLALLLLSGVFALAASGSLSLHWKLKSPMFYFSLFLTMAMSRTAVSFAQVSNACRLVIKKYDYSLYPTVYAPRVFVSTCMQISAISKSSCRSLLTVWKAWKGISASISCSSSTPPLEDEPVPPISDLSDERRSGRLSSTEIGDIQTRARALARMLQDDRDGILNDRRPH